MSTNPTDPIDALIGIEDSLPQPRFSPLQDDDHDSYCNHETDCHCFDEPGEEY
jgi:hypothetical protein